MRTLIRRSTASFTLIASGLIVTACQSEVRLEEPGNGLAGGTGGAAAAGGAGGSAGQGGGGVCVNGEVQTCYSANPATNGVGKCIAGTMTCVSGQWGACVGEVVPALETCNGEDDNCDGEIDNGNPGGGFPCNTGKPGVCSTGTRTCSNGGIVCVGNTEAAPETCDGLDNDCNGVADDGNPGAGSACTVPSLLGSCAQSALVCLNGMLSCPQTVFPAVELCNGLDENCDGQTDEGNPEGGGACTTGLPGECAAGFFQCLNSGIVCVQTTMPTAEVCDNKDNDCDGTVDNDNPGGGASCSTGQPGICAAGIEVCTNGTISCIANQVPQPEICNGLDENCDGQTDEGNPEGGATCTVTGNLGECAEGVLTCAAGTLTCPQTTPPVPEVCNDDKDNDCDGTVDNGCSSTVCNINGAALPLPISLPVGTDVGSMRFDPNCDIIMAGGYTGHVFRIDKTTGAITTLTSSPVDGIVYGATYRSSDNLIYFSVSNPSRLFSIPMAGGTPTFVMELLYLGGHTTTYDIVVSPPTFDFGEGILGGAGDGHLLIFNTVTHQSNVVTYSGIQAISALAFSPDGHLLVFTQPASNALVYIHDTPLPPLAPVALYTPNGVTVSTDGSRLLVTGFASVQGGPVISELSLVTGAKTVLSTTIPIAGGYGPVGIVADTDEVFVKSKSGTDIMLVKVP
jgi:Putative metal-binding motif